jgi:CTP synthase
MKEKIALFSNVAVDAVISAIDVSCIYAVPLHLHSEGLDELIADRLNIWSRQPDLSVWQKLVDRFMKPTRPTVKIGVIGKYVSLKDAYKSLHESLVHGSLHNDCKVELEYIDSEQVEKDGPEKLLAHLDAVLVPGGFGDRGTEGKIQSIGYARENKIPFFGICLGMQLAVVEFARHVGGMAGANSTEIDPDTKFPVVALMEGQQKVGGKGGSMRLGAYACVLAEGTRALEAYGQAEISERHRHRYEVNNEFRAELESHGLVLSGLSPDKKLVEMIELTDHPYFVACQFHPEFKSRPMAAHPLFKRFVRAMVEHRERAAPRPAGEAGSRPIAPARN